MVRKCRMVRKFGRHMEHTLVQRKEHRFDQRKEHRFDQRKEHRFGHTPESKVRRLVQRTERKHRASKVVCLL